MDNPLLGKKILLGVCGSIAAYKSVMLVRLLVKEGADVKVIMTTDAKEFVTPLTFSTVSKNITPALFTRTSIGVSLSADENRLILSILVTSSA